MPLMNFFSINMPYGIQRNKNNQWIVFNREYLPLGYNSKDHRKAIEDYEDLPLFTNYGYITDKKLLEIAGSEESVRRDELGKIYRIFLYDDGSNPGYRFKFWNTYSDKLKKLSALKRK